MIAFADDLTHAYIRWVDPADVITCQTVTADMGAFVAFLLSPQLPPDLPDLAAYGIHADQSDGSVGGPCQERIAKRRQDRQDRGLTIGRDGLVRGFRY